METFENEAFEKWGEAMAGGFQIVPNQLLRLQRKLGLSSHQVIILLNLSMHWWKRDDLPFAGPSIIAKRMGMSQRTVERQMKELCDMGLVKKKPLPEHISANGHTMGYDLTGLVNQLEAMTKGEARSGKIAEKLKGWRAARAEASRRETSSSSDLL